MNRRDRVFAQVAMLLVFCSVAASAEPKPTVLRLSQGKDLLGDAELAKRKLVVIYYANDGYAPRGDDLSRRNAEELAERLKKASQDTSFSAPEREWLALAADRFRREFDDFVDSTIKEIQCLHAAAGRRAHAVVVFRNRPNGAGITNYQPLDNLFRPFEFAVLREPKSEEGDRFHIPFVFFHPRFPWRPLAHPAIFFECLREAAKKFPPAEHRFLLIVRSPATDENMLADTASLDVAPFGERELGEALLAALYRGKPDAPVPSGNLVNQVLVRAFYAQERERRLKELPRLILEIGDKEAYSAEFGTSKARFVQNLFAVTTEQATRGMTFPLVVVAARGSDLSLSAHRDFKELASYQELNLLHVGRLVTFGAEPTGQVPLDLCEILRKADLTNSPGDLQSLLQSRLGIPASP
jgi:hypothetical protein